MAYIKQESRHCCNTCVASVLSEFNAEQLICEHEPLPDDLHRDSNAEAVVDDNGMCEYYEDWNRKTRR